jgi:Domain of unknown function (DUF5103)
LNLSKTIFAVSLVHLYIYRSVSFCQTPDSLSVSISIEKGIAEQVNHPNIKTVQLNRTDLELTYPVILLESEDVLTLDFDDLKGGVVNYYYTFEHCNQQWESSGLNAYDFLDGFEENRIDNYQFSFATLQKYTHYAISFPNDDVDFKLSGNYVIKVWEDDNRETPVLVKRFFVREDLVAVNGDAYRPNLIPYRNEFHEINFNVDIRNVDVGAAFDEIKVTVMQNGRFDNAKYDVRPRMISNNLLNYDIDDLVFQAGKEYRRFDTKTLKFQSDRIVKIEKTGGQYQVFVNVDESRVYQKYHYEKDANGQYVVHADLANNNNTESDYANVHFVLQYPYMITSGDVYVFGDLSGNQFTGSNKMTYDFDKQQYTCTLFLKQGYYNYAYVVKPMEGNYADFTYTEGNSFESENDYLIFIYQQEFSIGYDRLIGFHQVNSVK